MTVESIFALVGYLLAGAGIMLVLARTNQRSKHALAAAQRARLEIAQILESITDGFVAIDRDWRFTYVNAEGEKLLGKTREQMVGQSVWAVIPGMEGSVFHRHYLTAMNRRLPVVFEEHSLVVDKWFEVHAYPAENGISVYFHDVTAQREAQQKLRRSEEQYRELFENANDLLYTHDLLGNFATVNHACVATTGYTRAELTSMSLVDLVAPEHLDRARQMLLHKIQNNGGGTTYEVDLIARDGRRVPLEVSSRLVIEDGRPIAVQGIARDISERKRAEEALRSMSLTDPLTGLYNRRGILTLADQQIKMAVRLQRRLMLLYADLNHLKLINDTHGHAAGDAALVETARILQETFRESDIIARMGGDEFLVFALESDECIEETMRYRLNERFAQRNRERKTDYALRVSLGVSRFDPADPRSLDNLMIEADERMYTDKRAVGVRVTG